MRPLDVLRLSARAIRGHEVRSALTTLGVVVGIGAVIALVTLSASLQTAIIAEVGTGEASEVYVWASRPGEEVIPRAGAGAEPVFTPRDVDRLSNLSAVATAYPYAPVPVEGLVADGEFTAQRRGVVATHPPYVAERDVAAGRRFEPGAPEAVLNPGAADRLDNVTVGDTVQVSLLNGTRVDARVVGVLEDSEPQSAFEGFSEAPRVYLPVDPYYRAAAGDSRYSRVIVRADSPGQVGAARRAARSYLVSNASDAHERTEGLVLTLSTSEELLERFERILDTLTEFVVGIAAISLLVGAIGIANIMLVSVSERVNEVGIMKAVGAENRQVLGLFLVEAAALGLAGAVLGVAAGLAGGYLAVQALDYPLTYPLQWVPVAVLVGTAVGLLSGVYPAWKAARTDPIEALRRE